MRLAVGGKPESGHPGRIGFSQQRETLLAFFRSLRKVESLGVAFRRQSVAAESVAG